MPFDTRSFSQDFWTQSKVFVDTELERNTLIFIFFLIRDKYALFGVECHGVRWTGVQCHLSQCWEGCITSSGTIYSDRWMVLGQYMYLFVLYVTLEWVYWLNPLSLVFRLMVHICPLWFRGVPIWGSQKNFRGDVFKAKWACYVNISFELEKKCSRRWGVNYLNLIN